MKYVVLKGSITLDGISLTVNEMGEDFVGLSLIPETLKLTTLGYKKPGDKIKIGGRLSSNEDASPGRSERLAGDGFYETQERLITRIAAACAAHERIEAVEVALRKGPVRNGSGSLGVRLTLDAAALARLRPAPAT